MTEKKGNLSLPSSAQVIQSLIDIGHTEHPYSVEDFFKKPNQSHYKLSRDGSWFSYLAPYERRMNIFIENPQTKEVTQLTHETKRGISDYAWANENTIIYIKDDGGDENFKLYGVDVNTKELKDYTPFENVRIDIIDILNEEPDFIIIGMNKNDARLFEPYRLQLSTLELTQLADNKNLVEPISSWMTDHDGKIRLATKVVNGVEQVLMYRKNETDDFKEVLKTNFKEGVSPLFFHFDDPTKIFVSSNLNRDKSVITSFDLEKGEETGEIIFEHPDVDVSGLSYSKLKKELTLISYTTDKRNYHFLSKEREDVQKFLNSQFPNKEVVIVSLDKTETKSLVRTYSDRSLGAYYYFDIVNRKIELLSEVSPWIDENDMCPMESISYQSRDGLTINGYLTLPANKEAKNLPLVVNPHGGPWVRDNWGYNPEVQLMASRGFAVLQVNYRGSTGYGRDFWEKSFKKWGTTMQDDITDGVNWLIENGTVDANKVAIYGASYGGYATLAGVAFTPDLYACAINYVGVSNLLTFMQTIPPYWEPYLEMMHEMVGNPATEAEDMKKRSPVYSTDKIKTPLYVVQGANDPRVNIDESDQIVENLRNRGVNVPYLVKYDEGHGFRNEENQFEFYKSMIGFLAKYIG